MPTQRFAGWTLPSHFAVSMCVLHAKASRLKPGKKRVMSVQHNAEASGNRVWPAHFVTLDTAPTCKDLLKARELAARLKANCVNLPQIATQVHGARMTMHMVLVLTIPAKYDSMLAKLATACKIARGILAGIAAAVVCVILIQQQQLKTSDLD